MGSISLRSPISILATPPPSTAASLLLSGPHSAPATFTWGKQSPIARPPYHAPLLLTASPFLLSPGQDHAASASFAASSPRLSSSSPLLLAAASSPIETGQQAATSSLYLDSSFSHPSSTASSPTAASLGSGASGAAMMNIGRPDIPVGIAVARQRQTDQAAAAAAAAASLLTNKEPVAHSSPLPWGSPYHHPLFSTQAGGGLTPAALLHPLADYHHPLSRAEPAPLHGESAPLWCSVRIYFPRCV